MLLLDWGVLQPEPHANIWRDGHAQQQPMHCAEREIERQIDVTSFGTTRRLVMWSRHEKHPNASGHHHHNEAKHLTRGENVTLLLAPLQLAVLDDHTITGHIRKS